MPRKIDLITELYQRTINNITSDSVAWRAFLHSAAYQYKYSFADQVLIYAQRPHATACAEIQLWNRHFGRWIKRGATGIALIDGHGVKPSLRYVFDVSDTHHRENTPFEIWQLNPDYEADIIETLQNRFIDDGNPPDKITDAIMVSSINLATDNVTDYLQELSYEREGSFLEELDEDNLRMRFLITLQAGVAYTVLTRLGFDAEMLVGGEGFEWVHEFNTPTTVNILGTATSEISEICLREIERTVKSLERGIVQTNRTVDGAQAIGYNDGGKTETIHEKGGLNYDADVQNRERPTNSESGDARTDELSYREIREDAAGLHEGASQGDVYDDSDQWRVEQLPARDRRDGKDADLREHIPDGTEPWGHGADESREPVEVGTDDELDQELGRGRSVDIPNLRISDSTLPQISDPDSLIQILRHGDYLRHSKKDIVSFLSSNASEAEKTEYVKNAYQPLLFAEFYKQGTEEHLGYRAAEDGLLLYVGNFPSRTAESLMDWPFVTRLIEALISDRNYLDEVEAEQQQQLSFFENNVPEPSQKALGHETPFYDSSKQMRISQEVIDEFLRLGGCVRNSAQRIYGFYRRANNQAENVTFLKSEYQQDSVGIVVGGKNYAVKWNDAGVRISTGDRVSEITSIYLPWEVIDKRIRELLETGQYLPQVEADKADEIWEKHVADMVAFLYREDYENIPAEYKTVYRFTWPEVNDFYRNLFRDTDRLPAFIEEMKANEDRVKDYPGRFRRFHDGKKTAELVATFLRDPVEFPKSDPYLLPPKQFVTQDKIDAYLVERGTPFSDGKLAVYSFFLRNKDTKERASFLSHSYGVGGSGGGRIDSNHDGKGLALYGGLQHRQDGVLLKWPQVAIFQPKKKTVEPDAVPANVEQAIPIQGVFEDGIFLVGRNLWSKTFTFTDINYAVASRDDKEGMFLGYSEILNSLDSGATTKITINNRRIQKSKFEERNMLPLVGDSLDRYRREYNSVLERNANLSAGVVQDKFMTITVEKKTLEEAKGYFNRVGAEFATLFAKLGSKFEEVGEEDKIRMLYDFFHKGYEDDFRYDRFLNAKRGHDFKIALAPQSLEFRSDYFKMDGRFARVLYLKDYANFIKDSFIAELTDIDRSLMLSIDADPIPMDQAVRQGESKLLAVETNISNWQRKQNQNNNFSAAIPYGMERQREESREFLNDLVARDQRMIPALITLVHSADSKEQLDADTESILQCARKHLCSMSVLRWQQLEGLNTCLPYGGTKLNIRRTLTTESLAVFMPFHVQEVCHKNGLYIGNNAISKNMIMVNRGELLNGNSFITGVSGSGKSMMAKQELTSLLLSDKNADVIVIDPEREYTLLTEAFGGETVVVSATSNSHINAMAMSRDYADGANPVSLKSEFILSLCEQVMNGGLGAKEKSIIDRCTAIVYRDYMLGGCVAEPPTLKDFREVLLEQCEPEAKDIALAIELFTDGSLNTFAKQTNVNTHGRFICYDIHELGKQLMPIGMLVVLDSILNRITENRAKGRKTYIFIDEIYLLFRHEYSANFLFTLWKKVRKYNAFILGITQNVEDLLQSHTARTMLANSELVIMLNQAATDREQLAELMGISDLQLSYITNVEAGHGLVKIGGALVPFVNNFPKDTQLYKLMTTKPGESCR